MKQLPAGHSRGCCTEFVTAGRGRAGKNLYKMPALVVEWQRHTNLMRMCAHGCIEERTAHAEWRTGQLGRANWSPARGGDARPCACQ